jgi:hypothetical protein
MADLATFLAQLNQNAYIMEIIIKAIHIPENINQAGLAHCKEYLGRALDYMIKVGDAFRAISKQHLQELNTLDVRNASAKQDRLAAQFEVLTAVLRERTLAMPKLSTVNPPAIGQTVLTNAPATDNKLPNDTITQATVKYDQLRLDLGQLATNYDIRTDMRQGPHLHLERGNPQRLVGPTRHDLQTPRRDRWRCQAAQPCGPTVPHSRHQSRNRGAFEPCGDHHTQN